METEKGIEIETKRERENWKKGSKNQIENGKQRTKKRETRHKTVKSFKKMMENKNRQINQRAKKRVTL